MNLLCLDTIVIEPNLGERPKNVVVLLHGYGGSGKDISILANYWKRFLPNTIFLCPNGPEECSISATGYQWFDLSEQREDYIIKKSTKAELIFSKYLNEIKEMYELSDHQICLSGFSQGCMLALNIALKSEKKINCLVGFSGKIISKKNLINEIKSKPKIFLFHGDRDTIVPLNNLLETKAFFAQLNYKIKTKILKNCEHNIPTEASSLALNFIKKNLYG